MVKFLKRVFGKSMCPHAKAALKLQAEVMVLKSLFLRSSLFILSQNPELLYAVRSSCLKEIKKTDVVGVDQKDKDLFLEYAEISLEDIFSRVRVKDDEPLQTRH